MVVYNIMRPDVAGFTFQMHQQYTRGFIQSLSKAVVANLGGMWAAL